MKFSEKELINGIGITLKEYIKLKKETKSKLQMYYTQRKKLLRKKKNT